MSAKHKFKYDETKFRPGQRKAGVLLAEREFMPKEHRKTMDQIAEEVGVNRSTIWHWQTGDPNFIAYSNALASDMIDGHLAEVYSKLMDVIRDGNTKGIELFLKRIGDLDTRQDITLNDNRGEQESFEDRKAAILDRLGLDEGTETETESFSKDSPKQANKPHNGV